MSEGERNVAEEQRAFFNQNAELEKPSLIAPFFETYVNKEQVDGFVWLRDRKYILDYGCGTGTTIDRFYETNQGWKSRMVGVDIADKAIGKVTVRYPDFSFYTISDNKIPQLGDCEVDGAYLMHVLHHSSEHVSIFREIYEKLSPGGKFFLSDLSSSNPIINLFRNLFVWCPEIVKRKFSEDLVVDGNIPEKIKVDPREVVRHLESTGFTIEEVNYGHLFLFFFSWLDRFVPLSRIAFFRAIYSGLWAIENTLLKSSLFQKNAEVFCIKCIK